MGDEDLRRMADLLRSGATMLEDHCPACNSPLFRVKGEIWCPRCNRRVIKEEKGGEPHADASSLLGDVEKTILLKIQESCEQIMEEKDVANLERLSSLLVKWLEALERTRRIQRL